jgi:hypothetical protein
MPSTTAPHLEVNYGAVPNLQLHTIAPMILYAPGQGASSYGYGDTELGAKYRFVREGKWRPGSLEVILGEAESIGRFARKVILGDGEIGYDYLIIASGATHSYFGHGAWERDAPGLKTLEDALEIRRRVLVAYEAAEREPDPEIAHEWMTFVIVGAGPTGVELAGALAEISRRVLARDFRRLDPMRARIVLIEGTVVRKNSTTVMQRGPRGRTRGEVRSVRSALQLGLIGRNDAFGVGTAWGDSGADRAGRAPKKNVVGLDCNAAAKTTEFFEDAARLGG